MRRPSRERSALSGLHPRRGKRRHVRRPTRLAGLESLEARQVLAGLPIISEVLASNDRIIDDVDGDDSDYIELYNAGDEDMSLNRYYLTDDPNDLQKWRLPDVQLAAGEYLVVFASNKDRNDPSQELHTNFRVSASGEYLALVEPDGQTVAFAYSPGIPRQVTDVSYGVPTGIKNSTLIGRGSEARVLVPTDGSLDPTEGEGIDGTWLSPDYDDSGSAWLDTTVGLGYVPTDSPTEVTNSVTDFSGVQGQDGWEYGAWYKSLDSDGIYQAREFTKAADRFFVTDRKVWDLGPNGGLPNTELTAEGGQPSALFLTQWAVRRWVSEVEGEITISGALGNDDPSGDGIVGRIFVNGNEIFQRVVNGATGDYSVTATVAIGDFVDFAIDAGAADDETGDQTTFTASIVGIKQQEIPVVPMTDSSSDWNRNGDQGISNWYFGYYQQTDDPDQTYQAKDFQAFGPGYWDRNTWVYPGNTIDTQINRTSMTPHAANGIVQWVMRRWESPVDGTLVLDYDLSKAAFGGDGVTFRVMHNGAEVDAPQIDGEDTISETRIVTITGVKRGDYIDFAVDPLGPGVDPQQRDGQSDRTNIDIRISRLANVGESIDSDLGDAMRGISSSAYVRIPFTVDSLSSLDQITLNMMYDDGYVAYINGQLVASAGTPAEVNFSSAAVQDRSAEDATLFETIDITNRRGLFVEGENVLQVHLLNSKPADDEVLLVPELVVGTLTAELGQNRYFSVPTPGAANGLGASIVGPLVVESHHTPNTPLETEPIVVTAVVSETFGAVADVTLTYRVMYGESITVSMSDDGQGADEQAADGIYSGVIPAGIAQPGEMIRWVITARDSNGLRGRMPAQLNPSQDEEYLGTIVADPSVQSNLPVFHWFLEFPEKTIGSVNTPGSVFYDGEFYDHVNFSVHGQSSSGFSTKKRSLNVDFPNDHRLRLNDDLPRLEDINWLTNYADKTKMRNTLAYGERAASGGAYHLAFPIRVQQNGQFFAVYDFVEDPDERWLGRLGYDPPGAVYKMYNQFEAGTGEKKTRTDEDNSDLRAFVAGILKDNAPNVDFLMDNVNMAQMANFLAVFAITSNHDCCHKNYYAYHDTDGTGEWWFLPWDVDLSYGHLWGGFGLGYFDDTIYSNHPIRIANSTGNNRLTGRLYESVPGFNEMFLRRVRTLMDERIKPPGTPREELLLETRIDELYQLLKPDADLDNAKNPSNWGQTGLKTFDEAVQQLLNEFVTPRREFLYSQPDLPPAQVGNPKLDFGVIEFNPASGNQQEEYIQLINNNDVAVDISGWRLGGDVDWTFDPGTVLPAGFTLYASPDAKAFRARSEGPTGGMGLFVQGNYQGKLPNVGGTVQLIAADGEVVSAATYEGSTNDLQQYLRISEVMYNPLSASAAELSVDNSLISEDFEYIEFVNVSPTETLDLAGVHFTSGIEFNFANSQVTQLAPGQRTVSVSNPAAFAIRYGEEALVHVAGTFAANTSLRDSGERITLLSGDGSLITDFSYSDNAYEGWSERADGRGSSLQLVDPLGNVQEPTNWRASSQINGSPGIAETSAVSGIVINEVLSRPTGRQTDLIELYNTTDIAVDLNHFYLSDSSSSVEAFAKFALPPRSIAAHGYLVFGESAFNAGGGNNPNDFALNGTAGDELFLTVGNANGPTHFVDSVSFGAAVPGESFGRTPNGNGRLYPIVSQSFNVDNSLPRVGPLVVTELMFAPSDPAGAALAIDPELSRDNLEYIEIYNPTSETVILTDWRLRLGADFDFDAGTPLASRQSLLVVPFNAENTVRLNAFRAHYGLDENVQIVGGYGGKLSGAGDGVQLQRPGAPLQSDPTSIPRLLEDEVIYDDLAPWPEIIAGSGHSLTRVSANAYGHSAASWIDADPTPGQFGQNVLGDLTQDGRVDADDVERLHQAALTSDLSGDLTGNGIVDQDDMIFLVEDVLKTSIGDVNFDGIFDSNDLIDLLARNEFEDGEPGNSTYVEGDWDLDGDFTTEDLLLALRRGGYEGQPAAGGAIVAAVATAGELGSAVYQTAIAGDAADSDSTDSSSFYSKTTTEDLPPAGTIPRPWVEPTTYDQVFAEYEPHQKADAEPDEPLGEE